jgi:hypothetical protein
MEEVAPSNDDSNGHNVALPVTETSREPEVEAGAGQVPLFSREDEASGTPGRLH